MDANVKEMIDRVFDEGSRGAYQPREIIIKMLELDPASEEVAYLKERAAEMAHLATKDRGTLFGAIGVDMCSCDMNCKFCSFGTEWGLVTEEKKYTKEEIIDLAKAYVDAGVTTLTLRSTEFNEVEWCGFTADEAKELLAEAGFRLEPVDVDPRFRDGADTWWQKGDPADYVMPDPSVGADAGCCCGKSASRAA